MRNYIISFNFLDIRNYLNMSKQIYINPPMRVPKIQDFDPSFCLLELQRGQHDLSLGPAKNGCDEVDWCGLQACTAHEIQFQLFRPPLLLQKHRKVLWTPQIVKDSLVMNHWIMITSIASKKISQGLSSWPKSSQRPEWRWHPNLERRKILGKNVGWTLGIWLEGDNTFEWCSIISSFPD